MRITIIHTPADVKSPGLLDELRAILECAVEVREFLSDGTTGAADEQAFAAGLREHFMTWAPDAVVLSDRLNGSKHVARRFAREHGIGVLTLKESVFPVRAYFAPDIARTGGPPTDALRKPLEEFERFRLAHFLAGGRSIGYDRKLYKRLAGIRPALIVADHGSQSGFLPEDWHISAAEAINAAGFQALVCYRQRDVCGADSCEQTLLLDDGESLEEISCGEISLDRVIRACRCMVTNGSLLGLKALYMRKPVFVAGDCLYSGMGFTRDIPFGRDFKTALRKALEAPARDEAPDGYERFLYNFIFRDLLPLEDGNTRFAESAKGQVIDALFRALPIERGARVLAGG